MEIIVPKKYIQYIQQTPYYKNSENTPRNICKYQDVFVSPISSAIHKHRISSIKIQEQKEFIEFQLFFTYTVVFTLAALI